MIEEYIQGESLETFVSHQKSISEELIVKLGIQLCDIFTYLHHLSPYPILYQDLKPEHIILCGDQVKGVMIESYIEEGNQKIGDHIYGKSITDPCLGWEDSRDLIYTIADMCR